MATTKNSYEILSRLEDPEDGAEVKEKEVQVEKKFTSLVIRTNGAVSGVIPIEKEETKKEKAHPALDDCVAHIRHLILSSYDHLDAWFSIAELQELPGMFYRKRVINTALQEMYEEGVVTFNNGYFRVI